VFQGKVDLNTSITNPGEVEPVRQKVYHEAE
jgi:hypothetical protein